MIFGAAISNFYDFVVESLTIGQCAGFLLVCSFESAVLSCTLLKYSYLISD